MATGACGINCDVCKLNKNGSCSTCGPGKSPEAAAKLAVQQKLFGAGCPILECANMNQVNHCMSDCIQFPCENFSSGPYPFSQGFLDMQKRRLSENSKAMATEDLKIEIPDEYWDDLISKDTLAISNYTLSTPHESGIIFQFLNREILVDIHEKCLKEHSENTWITIDDPLLELITLIYFNRVKALYPKGKDLVSSRELKEGHFFKGPHEFDLEPLLNRFKDNPEDFRETAELLDGTSVDMADVAYMFLPFPRIPVYYLFWKKNDEFKAGIDILFDRSIEQCLDAAGIWGLVNLVTRCILQVSNN